MTQNVLIEDERKLVVVFRVEPGSLGPDGVDHVIGFCLYSQQELENNNEKLVRCEIIPRNDKSLPEMEYRVSNKKLSHGQASKYLSALGGSLDAFDDALLDSMSNFIEQYMGH